MQYAYPLLAILIWAGNTVVSKAADGVIFPAEIGLYRWLLAALLFTPFMLKPVIRNWAVIRPNLGKIFILGVLGMAVYQSLAYYAAAMTTATNMGIILSLMPLMALAMAIVSLGQRLTAGALGGALLWLGWLLRAAEAGGGVASAERPVISLRRWRMRMRRLLPGILSISGAARVIRCALPSSERGSASSLSCWKK